MAVFEKHNINAEIDDEMIPVIDELNKLGLKTVSCCSGHDIKMAQLCFDAKDIQVLLSGKHLSINWHR